MLLFTRLLVMRTFAPYSRTPRFSTPFHRIPTSPSATGSLLRPFDIFLVFSFLIRKKFMTRASGLLLYTLSSKPVRFSSFRIKDKIEGVQVHYGMCEGFIWGCKGVFLYITFSILSLHVRLSFFKSFFPFLFNSFLFVSVMLWELSGVGTNSID